MKSLHISTILFFLSIQSLAAQPLFNINGGETVTVQSGGVLFVEGTVKIDNAATLRNAGMVQIQSATLDNQGMYTGTGTLNALPSVNNGTVAPGAPVGTLTYSSNFTNVGTLALDINSAADFDRLLVTGTATAGGILTVNFGTYTPLAGQTFQIISATNYAGFFDEIQVTPNSINAMYDNGILTIFGALPIQLISLTAQKQGDAVLLNWQTTTEVNNRGFDIQRSANGQTWETLHVEPGNGTTSAAKYYSFLDRFPLHGINYYRLRQVDFNGKSELTKIVSVAMTANRDLLAFPNPIGGGELSLYLSGHSGESLALSMYNSAGQLVRSGVVQDGFHLLSVRDLPAGIYTVQIVQGQERFIEKVVIQ